MPRRRLINGAIQGFLGTFTSRYSAYRRYWLFGFLVERSDVIAIDLLSSSGDNSVATPVEAAKAIATRKFRDQVEKRGIPLRWIAGARLDLYVLNRSRVSPRKFGGKALVDFMVAVNVESDLGRTYSGSVQLEVAPHDPDFETQSATAA